MRKGWETDEARGHTPRFYSSALPCTGPVYISAKPVVRRAGGPADHDEENVEHKERNREVVHQGSPFALRPELIASPEKKGDGQQRSFEEFCLARAADELIGEIGHRDEDERERPEQIAGVRGNKLRIAIHQQQHGGSNEGGNTQKDGDGPARGFKTTHRKFQVITDSKPSGFPGQKEFEKEFGRRSEIYASNFL
jgi:hypothetical protein